MLCGVDVAGCALTEDYGATNVGEAVHCMRVFIVPLGRFDSDIGVLTPGDRSGRRLKVPVYAYLVECSAGLVLMDTGCSEALAKTPTAILGDDVSGLTPEMGQEDHIVSQLALIGYAPGDVDLVLNSHLHFDHAGSNNCFPAAEFWCQEAEWEAVESHPTHYPDPGWNPGPAARRRSLRGDTPVAAGVTLVSTPGHTPGHQSLLVEAEEGAMLFTSDAVYTREHFDPDHLGAAVDKERARQSVLHLMKLARGGARPFFSHDAAQVGLEGWRVAPAFYR